MTHHYTRLNVHLLLLEKVRWHRKLYEWCYEQRICSHSTNSAIPTQFWTICPEEVQ